MGQVNVNPPPAQPVGEPPGSAGTGMILGIIVAIIVIALLVWFLVFSGGAGAPADGADETDGLEVVPTEILPTIPAPTG